MENYDIDMMSAELILSREQTGTDLGMLMELGRLTSRDRDMDRKDSSARIARVSGITTVAITVILDNNSRNNSNRHRLML